MNMRKLHPQLHFSHDETHLSWTGRMAALHLSGGIAAFLADLRIPLQAFHSGYPEVVRQLCHIADVDPAPVLRNTIQRFSPYTYLLRSESFGSSMLNGRVTKFCPQCLLDDAAQDPHPHRHRRERLSWLFRATIVCPLHHIVLQGAAPQPGIAPDLSVRVAMEARDLAKLTGNAERLIPSPLQNYLLARLEGKTCHTWLDGQNLDQAVQATEMLGAVMAFGPKVNINTLTVADWHRAACVGWQWTSLGEASLREAFTLIQSSWPSKLTRRDRAPGQSFGSLYQWLVNPHLKADRGPIKELLRAHILETEPVTTDRKILGQMVRRSRIQPSNLIGALGHDSAPYNATS